MLRSWIRTKQREDDRRWYQHHHSSSRWLHSSQWQRGARSRTRPSQQDPQQEYPPRQDGPQWQHRKRSRTPAWKQALRQASPRREHRANLEKLVQLPHQRTGATSFMGTRNASSLATSNGKQIVIGKAATKEAPFRCLLKVHPPRLPALEMQALCSARGHAIGAPVMSPRLRSECEPQYALIQCCQATQIAGRAMRDAQDRGARASQSSSGLPLTSGTCSLMQALLTWHNSELEASGLSSESYQRV